MFYFFLFSQSWDKRNILIHYTFQKPCRRLCRLRTSLRSKQRQAKYQGTSRDRLSYANLTRGRYCQRVTYFSLRLDMKAVLSAARLSFPLYSESSLGKCKGQTDAGPLNWKLGENSEAVWHPWLVIFHLYLNRDTCLVNHSAASCIWVHTVVNVACFTILVIANAYKPMSPCKSWCISIQFPFGIESHLIPVVSVVRSWSCRWQAGFSWLVLTTFCLVRSWLC